MGALFRPLIRARTWKETLHLLVDLPLGIAWFTIIVTGIALGVGLIPLMFIGVLVLLAHAPVRAGRVGDRAGSSEGLARRRHREPVHADRRDQGLVAPHQGRARRRRAVEGRRVLRGRCSPSASSRSLSPSRSGRSPWAGSPHRSGRRSRRWWAPTTRTDGRTSASRPRRSSPASSSWSPHRGSSTASRSWIEASSGGCSAPTATHSCDAA